ncbi:MAG: beta-lactamase family protein [Ignavibacteriaceae bacterium]|nr:beta-lactamase family protein [Ignavibacteriaceae bacterium]
MYGQNNFRIPIEEADKILEELIFRQDVVGATICVGMQDSIIHANGYGFVNKDDSTQAESWHKFRIYSLSKHITAIAAAKLSEEGRLNLDRSIVTYIPFLNENLHNITTRQLIGHISGIRSYREGEWQVVSNERCSSPFESILSFQSDSLLFTPGEDIHYTSFGYVLLSAVIEKVTGKQFIKYINEDILYPIGVTNLTLDNPDIFDSLAAAPYEYWKETMYDARYANNTCKFGGGGFSASTSDIVKFNLALLNGEIVNSKTLEMIFSSMKLKDGTETNYGFGLEFSTDEKGRKYAWHSGRSRGGRNALVIYPEYNLIVCISMNTNGERIVNETINVAKGFVNRIN